MVFNYSLKKKTKKQIWDAENIFYLKSETSRISKFIYHYEIYKKILDLPGHVIEFGVFKGVFIKIFIF